jgi:hypothetical protein
MPNKLKDRYRQHFKKPHYNKRDWKSYDQALQDRGNLTIWFSKEAVAAWNPTPEGKRKRGRQPSYSDLARILRLCYKQGLRQTEGMVRSILSLLGLELRVPDHTTLSRRAEDYTIFPVDKERSRAVVHKSIVPIQPRQKFNY